MAAKSGWSVPMPKAATIMPRAPWETCGRTFSMATAFFPRLASMVFTVSAMSGAVSARVPSRSKRTASSTHGPQQVVHVHVPSQRIHFREGIVGYAGEVGDLEAGFAARPGKLRRTDEACVFVRALRQKIQHV